MPESKGYIVPHTHWDREWRYPLWESRMHLVRFMDELMDTLEADGGYKSFLLDGQTAPIRDYLAVRPQNTERLHRLIREGRIFVGPWFTLPDLYPISGESIVRNLVKGMLEAEKLGNCLRVGYESFGWGQPGQFPQIYQGVGIQSVIVAKNVDKARAPDSEFIWVGADGSSVLATRLGIEARANFFMHAYLKIMTGKNYKSSEYHFRYGEDGLVFHDAGNDGDGDFFKLENLWEIHPEHIRDAVAAAWDAIGDTLLTNDRILMDGSDSTTCQPRLMDILKEFNSQSEGIRLVPSDLHEYEAVMLEKLQTETLKKVYGELRDGPVPAVSGNALMTRAPVKIQNRLVQNKLIGVAEPMAVCAALVAGTYEKRFLDTAMEYMLLSHAHDSINGVTQDKTVQDVQYRLSQAEEIADTVSNAAFQTIVSHLDMSPYKNDDILLIVFNPLAHERREIIKASVHIPRDWGVWDFSLEGPDGVRPVQHISREEKCVPVCSMYERPMPLYADRHHFWLDTGVIPPGGYQTYRLIPGERFERQTEFWARTRKTAGEDIAVSATRLENEHLIATVNGNGTVTVVDKETGISSGELNYLESAGDNGDYWVYYPPYNNRTYSSKGVSASIWLEENGPLSASVCAEYDFHLPARSLKPERHIAGDSRRSDEKVPLPVSVRYRLQKGMRQLDVELTVHNTARDHRLSVLFDTGILSEYADAQGHFCVDRRHGQPPRDSRGQYFNELATQPMQNFCDVSDGKAGMGIATDSLGEYELRAGGVLSMTLFRAVRNVICTEWRSASVFPKQQGGQLLREIRYRYAICPHGGDWLSGDLQGISQRLNAPPKPAQIGGAVRMRGHLGPSHSFFSIHPGLALSALKLSENGGGFICRVFNPSGETVEGDIRLAGTARAYTADLRERLLEPLPVTEDRVRVTVKSNEILTVYLEPQQPVEPL